jgi:hypothetical protein
MSWTSCAVFMEEMIHAYAIFYSQCLKRKLRVRGKGAPDRKSTGKVHPITGHERPEREWRYSSTLSLTSAQDGVGAQHHAPDAVPPPPGKENRTPFIGGWVGPKAGRDGCRKSRPQRNSIPGPSSP